MMIQQPLVPRAITLPMRPSSPTHRFMALPSVANMDTGIETTRRWPGVVTQDDSCETAGKTKRTYRIDLSIT